MIPLDEVLPEAMHVLCWSLKFNIAATNQFSLESEFLMFLGIQ